MEHYDKIEIIRTSGGHRKYNVDKYIDDNKKSIINKQYNDVHINNINRTIDGLNICYIRVSTLSQKDDLSRQREYMIKRYPRYKVIEDVGSGINFNIKGFRKIIHLDIAGKVNELVIAYKDRLTRFGFELIEDLIKEHSNGKIVIESNTSLRKEPRVELVEDVLQILNVYTAKMNGLRKYGHIK